MGFQNSTTLVAEEEGNELPAVVEEKYKKKLEERRREIVRHMSKIDKMAQIFQERKLLDERATNTILQRALLHQKAEALMDALIKTASFKNVLLIKEIFSQCHNHTASECFLAILSDISTTDEFDHGLIVNSKEYKEHKMKYVEDSTTDSTDTAFSDELVDEGGGVVIEMPKLEEKNRGARAIIKEAYSYQLEEALKEIQSISDLIDCPETGCETSLHYALHELDEADCRKALEIILKRFQELVDIENTVGEKTLDDFINMKCKFGGYTALHMAIRFRDIASVRLLYRDYGADIFIEDENGQTPLEMMYLHLPEEVNFILDSSLKSCAKSHISGKMIIGADFSTLLGVKVKSLPDSEDWGEKRDVGDFATNDLAFLANVVNTDSKRQKFYLPHPLIALFLLIQWRRYKGWILASVIMQIFLKILYATLVVHVFLYHCRYKPPKLKTLPKDLTTSNSSWNSVPKRRRYYPCSVDFCWKIVAGILVFFSGFLMFHEFVELYYKITAMFHTSKSGNFIQKIFSGVRNYVYDLENVLQLLCATLMLYICMRVLRGTFAGFDYAIASGSMVLGSILIMIELGNFSLFSVYIQIFIKVTKSFAKFLSLYAVLFIAFSISFSIAFPQEEEFRTLLEAIPRMVIMMSGELNYKEIVFSNKPKMFKTGQIVFVSFVLLMSFILTNLLIGLVVSDVKELMEKAQVVAMSVKLERCNTMANTLRLCYWRWMLYPLKKLIAYSYWIIRKFETRSGGNMSDLEKEKIEFKLESWHNMKLGPNSRITMLQLPEKLQNTLEKLLQPQPGTKDNDKN